MRCLKISVFLFLTLTLAWAQSNLGGPLQIDGQLIAGAQYDPYCPGSGIQMDRATRVRLELTNPTQNDMDVSQLLGTFYDGNGQSLFLDRQAAKIKAGETQTIFLYYNNTARVQISSVLVTAVYENGGKNFQSQVAVTPAGLER